MDLGVGPHASQGLAPVATELAGVGSVRGVAVSHVCGQGGGGGAGHGTGRALVLHHVTPHVVPQQPRGREGLSTGGAGKLLVRLLATQVIEELGPGGEESSAGGAGHQLLLAVAAHVLPQLGHGGVGPAAAGPPALEGGAQGGGVAAHVPVEVLGRGHQEGGEGGLVPGQPPSPRRQHSPASCRSRAGTAAAAGSFPPWTGCRESGPASPPAPRQQPSPWCGSCGS